MLEVIMFINYTEGIYREILVCEQETQINATKFIQGQRL